MRFKIQVVVVSDDDEERQQEIGVGEVTEQRTRLSTSCKGKYSIVTS